MNELDELRLKIAELQGWTKKHGRMDQASREPHDYFVKPDGLLSMYPPDWPREIAAAWVLLEEMQQAGLNIEINIWLNGYVIGIWRPGEQLLFKRRYDTAPEAICRAYRAWREAQKP
jgi:hypothetical protein